MDAHQFLYSLQERNYCTNWMPWTQGIYIAEKLKGGLDRRVIQGMEVGYRSQIDRGICWSISAYVMRKWLENNGVSWEVINDMEKESEAEHILDLYKGHLNVANTDVIFAQAITTYMESCGYSRKFMNVRFALRFVHNLNNFANIGTSYVGLVSGGAQVGHAIAINGRDKAVFDPNIGFAQGTNIQSYKSIIHAIFQEFYEGHYDHASVLEFG